MDRQQQHTCRYYPAMAAESSFAAQHVQVGDEQGEGSFEATLISILRS
jgi:hypothetical protein